MATALTDDLYALMGVAPSSTPAEILQGYTARVTQCAADPTMLIRLAAAFQTLADPAQRAAYDQSRIAGAVPSASPAFSFAPPPDASDLLAPLPNATTRVDVSGTPGATGAPWPDATVQVNTAPGATVLPGSPTMPVGSALGEATQMPIAVTCPVCATPNMVAIGGDYCQDCGFLLSQTPGEAAAPAPAAAVSLVLANGSREFPLHEGDNLVGRQDADVLIIDPTVSRLHAHLYLTGISLEVEDVNSTNGTRINGARLQAGQRLPVGSGDDLRFGNVTLQVRGAAAASGPTGTLIEPGARPSGPPAVARLVALSDGKEYPIYTFPATIGRRAEHAVAIMDPYISGRHAEIVQEGGKLLLRDLGSTNGSGIGEDLLEPGVPGVLTPDATVVLGKQRFRWVVNAPAEGSAPTSPPGMSDTPGEAEAPAGAPAGDSPAGQLTGAMETTASDESTSATGAQNDAAGASPNSGEHAESTSGHGVPPSQGETTDGANE